MEFNVTRRKTYEEILRSCISKGEKFTDEDFPPVMTSLISPGIKHTDIPWNEIEWIRATQIAELNDKEGQLAIFY